MTIPVPHLTTANNAPLRTIERQMLEKQIEIEAWFRPQWRHTPAPLTSSVDIRNAGFKIAPVDTNLFPAGFNNLNPDFMPLCTQAAQSIMFDSMPDCWKILIIPESHTRNLAYLESLAVLQTIFKNAGFEVRIGSLDPQAEDPCQTVTLNNGNTLTLYKVHRQGDCLWAGDFMACLILLNNDLSDSIPEILQNLAQPVRPSAQLGWSHRLKSDHFRYYDQTVSAFCQDIGFEPWHFAPSFSVCQDVDFKEHHGEAELATLVDELLANIEQKYQAFGIDQQPFVVIKADAGTYGMGVIMVQSGEELLHLNRKQRKKMVRSKGRRKIAQVIIQEGVPTSESWQQDDAVAEPVVYMIGHHVIGGFYRVHTGKGVRENLNAPGMHFEPLAFAQSCHYPDPATGHHRFYVYGVIARLAALAAAKELAALTQKT